jgi:phthiocerol/phenolphthiocerol synthesis type-I polyketide synthase E
MAEPFAAIETADYPAHSVAIVGLAGRFPGARDLEELWRNIREGVESLETLSDADLEAAGVDSRLSTAPAYVRKATTLEGADLFDAGFFGMAPREAQILDPQQRVFLECAWEALEHAGHVPGPGACSVGVYAGAGMNTYLLTQIMRNPELMAAVGGYQLMLGNDKDFLCTRVSYKLDLHGPSVTLQTACSTSLVAVVMACRALERGECDLALAGGVSIPSPQRTGYLYEPGMILSPDGHCRPFDIHAAGTRPSAGCGVVALKRLADARADGDTIHAVILGAAINNDGAGKAGFTAPSVEGQVEAVVAAQTLAGVSARSIGYIEAHGTGTPLGDPIEIAALTQVFRASTPDVGFCRLGSLKANLGHLDAAAGVAGLIKTVLVLKNRAFPPLVNFTAPNPELRLEDSPFRASATAQAWESDGGPRLAGVSSFGIGGTNAHVVLREPPQRTSRAAPREAHLLVLSARTPSALQAMSENLRAYLVANPQVDLGDVECTLQTGRRTFPHRRALVVRTVDEAVAALSDSERQPGFTSHHEGAARSVAFLFSGQGSQFAGMTAGLYRSESVYREAIDRCARTLDSMLGEDIRRVMFETDAGGRINETRLAQPALFAAEYALAQLWKSWGVEPVAMLGHSIGELVAAHLAGVMSLEDVLTIVAARGRLMQSLPAGGMAAVHLAPSELRSHLPAGVEIAAINAPAVCTVSGPTDAVSLAMQRLRAAGVETRQLHTSHAFHSAMMEPALEPFTRLLETIALEPPRIPYISNVTGTWITVEQARSPAYYAQHLRQTVQFAAGVAALGSDSRTLLLEIGPGNALTTLARMSLGLGSAKRVIQSIGRAGEDRADAATLREAVGRLWLAGAHIDFAGMHAGGLRRIPLPTYPFERTKYGVEPARPTHMTSASAALQSARGSKLEDWVFTTAWTLSSVSLEDAVCLQGTWLVSGEGDELSKAVIQRLEAAGAQAIEILPDSAEEIGAVLARLRGAKHAGESSVTIAGAIHLWGLGDTSSPERSYQNLVALGIALGNGASSAVRIVHVSANAESVLDEPVRQPAGALALGPVLVLPVEVPNLQMSIVDLDASSGALDTQTVAAALVLEAALPHAGQQSAWRLRRRWLKHFERLELPRSGERLPVTPGGVYLVTGGLGGIGLSLSGWLAESFKARLLLTSRSGLTADTMAAVRALEAAGSEVIVAAADAADEAAMSHALALAIRRWGRINGVIHCAGNSGSGKLAALTNAAEARTTFGPKVGGLDVLVALLGQTPLDFVALMSSINSVVGAAGVCDYAAANAVLDSFAQGNAHPRAWRHVVSFNWDAWRDKGMALNVVVPPSQRAMRKAYVESGIPSTVGIEAFARGLASGRRRVVVDSHGMLAAIAMQRLVPRTASTAVNDPIAEPVERSASTGERPALSTEFAEPHSGRERQLAAIWSELLGVEPVGRHDDFFELGGHSLLATRVLTRVQESLGVVLQLRDVFDAPTVMALARRIDAAVASPGEEREEIEF